MERMRFLTIAVLFSLAALFSPAQTLAQPALERLSLTERSDGKGYVIRFHLTEDADSFRVSQPQPNLIQMMIYSDELDPVDFIQPRSNRLIKNIEYQNNPSGFGVDIFLNDGEYYIIQSYPDRNNSHLLIALERSTEPIVKARTTNQDFINWLDYQVAAESTVDMTFSGMDEALLNLRNGNGINVIVLDPGHGGRDPGAVNQRLGIYEKDITLAVALKVGEYINTYMPDVKVVYTREDDRFIDLAERGPIASRANGYLFISIHANSVANNTTANGAEVYILGLARTEAALASMKRENSAANLGDRGEVLELTEDQLLVYELANAGNMAISERIASMIENQFSSRAQRRSRGVKQAGFQVLWDLPMPSVLIELGFITNPNEAQYMSSEYGQAILASAIFRAIRDFKVELEKSNRPPSTASND
jgi:N-acetylmuramoyl-L-alanine amidase